jgi:hypothetical protein
MQFATNSKMTHSFREKGFAMSRPPELSDQWEVVKRQGNYGWVVFQALLGMLLAATGSGSWAPTPNSVTWTVRHKPTGATRTVTAFSADEAITKVNSGQFDRSAT